MGYIGLLLSLIVLVVFSYKRWNIILISIAASVIVALTNGIGIWEALDEYYMPTAVNFIQSWFLVFTFGAIFSELLNRSGAVTSITYKFMDLFGKENASLVISTIAAILTIGGVNIYVQIFMIWPMCIIFSKEIGIPRGTWLGVWYMGTFAGFNFPGNPSMPNIIVSQALGVSGASAMFFSILIFLFNFILGNIYFKWYISRCMKKNILYHDPEVDHQFTMIRRENSPKFWKSIAPMAFMIVVYSILSANKLTFLPMFDSVSAVILAMVLGSVLCVILHAKILLPQIKPALTKSAGGGVNPVFTAAVVSGYLGVIMGTPMYDNLVGIITGIEVSPYIQVFIACNVLVFIAGGGGIAAPSILTAFKDGWFAAGIDPAVLRPVMAASLAGTCNNPYSGGLHGVFDYTKSDLKESYGAIFFGSFCVNLLTSLFAVFIAAFVL